MNDILLIMKNLKELNKTIKYLFYLNNFTGLTSSDASNSGKNEKLILDKMKGIFCNTHLQILIMMLQLIKSVNLLDMLMN